MIQLLKTNMEQLFGCLLLLVGLVEAKLPNSTSVKGRMNFLLFTIAILYIIIGLII